MFAVVVLNLVPREVPWAFLLGISHGAHSEPHLVLSLLTRAWALARAVTGGVRGVPRASPPSVRPASLVLRGSLVTTLSNHSLLSRLALLAGPARSTPLLPSVPSPRTPLGRVRRVIAVLAPDSSDGGVSLLAEQPSAPEAPVCFCGRGGVGPVAEVNGVETQVARALVEAVDASNASSWVGRLRYCPVLHYVSDLGLSQTECLSEGLRVPVLQVLDQDRVVEEEDELADDFRVSLRVPVPPGDAVLQPQP